MMRIGLAAAPLTLLLALPVPVALVRQQSAPHGVERVYYIAAEEVIWNYAPAGTNLTGRPVPENEAAEAQTIKSYRKAIYREYTDDTFRIARPRSRQWEHLGILGPLIRAEVGDTVRVVFLNRTKLFCSVHPHGLAYRKESEGAFYNDGTSGADRADDLIPPDKSHTYVWTVPDRAGPAAGDGSSVLWIYHSHFTEPQEMNSGLMGPIVVTGRGLARPDGSPKDVDREFVLALAVFDETASAYTESNIRPGPRIRDVTLRRPYVFYTINGLIEGNLAELAMKRGEHVRWYLLSNGNEEDVHAAHWHGQTVVVNNMRSDTVPLGPMAMSIADMVPDNEGTWLFHCHVHEHIEGGMQALFKVDR